jgi:hypothetical protein
LDTAAIEEHLDALIKDEAKLEALEVDKEALESFLATDSAEWTQSDLDDLYATHDVLKLELIQRILVNDFTSEDTNEMIRNLIQVQNDIEKIRGDKVERDD